MRAQLIAAVGYPLGDERTEPGGQRLPRRDDLSRGRRVVQRAPNIVVEVQRQCPL